MGKESFTNVLDNFIDKVNLFMAPEGIELKLPYKIRLKLISEHEANAYSGFRTYISPLEKFYYKGIKISPLDSETKAIAEKKMKEAEEQYLKAKEEYELYK